MVNNSNLWQAVKSLVLKLLFYNSQLGQNNQYQQSRVAHLLLLLSCSVLNQNCNGNKLPNFEIPLPQLKLFTYLSCWMSCWNDVVNMFWQALQNFPLRFLKNIEDGRVEDRGRLKHNVCFFRLFKCSRKPKEKKNQIKKSCWARNNN